MNNNNITNIANNVVINGATKNTNIKNISVKGNPDTKIVIFADQFNITIDCYSYCYSLCDMLCNKTESKAYLEALPSTFNFSIQTRDGADKMSEEKRTPNPRRS